jgi:molybdopterin synthase catalytic subunit
MGDIKDGDANEIWEMSDQNCYVGLTHDFLNIQEAIDKVRSPQAGAIVLFAGWLWDTLISVNMHPK